MDYKIYHKIKIRLKPIILTIRIVWHWWTQHNTNASSAWHDNLAPV